jgi:hypothetical protein
LAEYLAVDHQVVARLGAGAGRADAAGTQRSGTRATGRRVWFPRLAPPPGAAAAPALNPGGAKGDGENSPAIDQFHLSDRQTPRRQQEIKQLELRFPTRTPAAEASRMCVGSITLDSVVREINAGVFVFDRDAQGDCPIRPTSIASTSISAVRLTSGWTPGAPG